MIDALYIPGARHFEVEVTVYRDWRYERHVPCTYHFWHMDDGMEFWREDYLELKSGANGKEFKLGEVLVKVLDEDYEELQLVSLDPFEYLCMSPDDKVDKYQRPRCHLPVEVKLTLEEDLPQLYDLIKNRDIYKAQQMLYDLEYTLEEHQLITYEDEDAAGADE